ncbi:hypothetical protein [Phenylobacterium soli]|uniref:Uncharacterized protein n=1 Tax=Phenylobacterium soli TaxID=2170551 RepID=A0A328AG78_9CAUL|nr:hypothetical protein [Phenylobacterium soli]RAK51818.1 hypothetical protein DJ017_18550 [Phenylobacterium soli]
MQRSSGATAPPPQAAFAAALARTPMDLYVVWNGARYAERQGSLSSRTLQLVTEPRTPLSLRELILRAARLEDGADFTPDAVRAAVRQHQAIRGVAYYLVRKTREGHFVAVSDVAWPADGSGPIRAGDLIATRPAPLRRLAG